MLSERIDHAESALRNGEIAGAQRRIRRAMSEAAKGFGLAFYNRGAEIGNGAPAIKLGDRRRFKRKHFSTFQ